jgi:hypothetical protein
VTDFLQKLMQEGINEPKVESHGNVVVIHLVSLDRIVALNLDVSSVLFVAR